MRNDQKKNLNKHIKNTKTL